MYKALVRSMDTNGTGGAQDASKVQREETASPAEGSGKCFIEGAAFRLGLNRKGTFLFLFVL